MQPSSSQVALAFAEPKQEKRQSMVPLLSFLTFSPTQNVLEHMGQQQRQFFFESLMQLLHCQNVEEMRRTKDILCQRVVPLMPSLRARQASATVEHAQNQEAAVRSYSLAHAQQAAAASSEKKKPKVAVAAEGGTSQRSPILQAGPFSTEEANLLWKEAQEKLAYEIADYSRGNAQVASEIIEEFKSRLESQSYKANDPMATLLMVIEDHHYREKSVLASGPRQIPPLLRVPVPLKLKKAAQQSSQTNTASVREMLYYYFARHQQEFIPVLAAAIGLQPGKGDIDEGFLEALAGALAAEGNFALANRMLAEIKRRKRMDAKKCLLELGYLYDPKSKKLIVGKRACGKVLGAKTIIDFLLGKAGARKTSS